VKRYLLIITMACLVCSGLSSCIQWSRIEYFWRGDFLKVNVSDSLASIEVSPLDRDFARDFYSFDSKLTLILRRLECLEEKKFLIQSDLLLKQYPWLGGVFYVEVKEGKVEKELSSTTRSMGKVDFKDVESIYARGEIGEKYLVRQIDGRQWLLLVKKENKGENRYSFMIVSIDLASFEKSVFALNSNPLAVIGGKNQLLVFRHISPDIVLSLNWESLLRHCSRGEVVLRGKRYYWMARYIGDIPLFYVVQCRG